MRKNERSPHQLRPVLITPNINTFAEGSCKVEFGNTQIICTATYEPKVPQWLQGGGEGWISAEYGMLPRSTQQRMKRDKTLTSGRTQEISRLIGRSLRAAVDLKAMGDKQILIDCDVIIADGGTRTAAVTGAFVAMGLAFKKLLALSEIKSQPLTHYVSAVSVGLQKSEILIDLDYDEDVSISTDMNFVMTNSGKFVEVQGTAEDQPFSKEELLKMMEIAEKGCNELFLIQEKILGSFFPLAKKELV